jgi:hypothetical protein
MDILIPVYALIALNFIDIYFTVNTFLKKGYRIENNPILRSLLRDNIDSFMIFKLFDVMVLCILFYWIQFKNEFFAWILLSLTIVLYLYIDVKNYQAHSSL